MPESFLLSRVLIRFNGKADEPLSADLSAAALTPDGSLWVGSDETRTIERLSPVKPYIFGKHQQFFVKDFIDLFDPEGEIDIEGMDYTNHYLWFIGSHSTKRKKMKGKDLEKDLDKLATIKFEANRYLLARIPVVDGELSKSVSHPEQPDKKLTAACLQKIENSNVLIEALKEDRHLGPFLTTSIPSKENGFDIEGLAIRGDRIFIGLRGPVLRGWAIILEVEVAETAPGILTLKKIGKDGQQYKKHFVELNGLGVRELCLDGEDLIILAGPTMDLEGSLRVFRLKNALERDENSVSWQKEGELEVLFDLPFRFGSDHAEGLALFPCLGQPNSLMVVYDSPDENRVVKPNGIFADVFSLKSLPS
ncbi:DUF3616 domain-containing protein [Coleofasciculus sp. FACHB-1120]|uniref:DUF3616 domain-containing protein n=1 Tax=Coleofasciculus sp. FACHB-1120 TaxID=2692783 RepID=UPI001688B105|nr:DUF3616 domain-containing protein [Coleofasciculus sp. FACHB-1120]MBD2740026.1 DUF3616 domain-containing protein [Coleofasciculus sp. FACHB-1120]